MTETQIYANREARIRLTTKCNYHCFFCHEEGGCKAPVAEWKSLKALLLALKAQGRRELTFTGGEPLLNRPILLKALAEVSSWDEQPEVTLVTNASLMDESVVTALERCRSAKVHVSVHDPRTAGYQRVTGQRFCSALNLKPILRRLGSGPVRLKLNAALTSDFAEDGDALDAILDFAHEVGADAVKFVELLATKDSSSWSLKHVPIETLEERFSKEGYAIVRRMLRTSYWQGPNGIILEATRCACALGCEHCEATRGDYE